MIAHSTRQPVAGLGRVHGRRQFTLVSMVSALLMLMLSLSCFAHASSPANAAPASIHSASPSGDADAGRSSLPLSIPPTTPIKLRTSDGQVFDTTAATVSRSSVITALLTDVSHAANVIPLPANVTAASMTQVLIWLDHHQDTGLLPSYNPIGTPWPLPAVSDWDQAFLDSLDNETLVAVMLAAHDLNLRPLMYMGTGQVARMIAGKTSNEIADMFNIENELTPEEEEAIRRENERLSQEL